MQYCGYTSNIGNSNFSRHNIHGERTSPCRFCVDFERIGVKRWGFSERVRVNSGGFGAAHTHIGYLWEYPLPGLLGTCQLKSMGGYGYFEEKSLSPPILKNSFPLEGTKMCAPCNMVTYFHRPRSRPIFRSISLVDRVYQKKICYAGSYM